MLQRSTAAVTAAVAAAETVATLLFINEQVLWTIIAAYLQGKYQFTFVNAPVSLQLGQMLVHPLIFWHTLSLVSISIFLKQTSNHALKYSSHINTVGCCQQSDCCKCSLFISDRGNVTIQGLPRMTAE